MLTQLCLRGRVLLVVAFFSVIGVTAVCGQTVTSGALGRYTRVSITGFESGLHAGIPILAGGECVGDIATKTGQAQETIAAQTQAVSALIATKQASGRDVFVVA